MKRIRDVNRAVLRVLAATAVACGMSSFVGSQLVYNWTESVPRGLYWLTRSSDVDRGALVAAAVPASVQRLVRERQYLPSGAMLLKPMAAAEGDHVCTTTGVVVVNGKPIGKVLSQDSMGRPLPRADICKVLGKGEIYLASSHPQSFDSRVFGPVRQGDLRGEATALWTY